MARNPIAAAIDTQRARNRTPTSALVFPPDIGSVSPHCVIGQFEIKNIGDPQRLADAGTAVISGIISDLISGPFQDGAAAAARTAREVQELVNAIQPVLTARGTYRLPMPMQGLEDSYSVQYNDGFQFFPKQLGAVQRGAEQVSGLYQNTFKSITLDAPEFRNFQLRWKLSPKDLPESTTIQTILYRIRRGMTPDTILARTLFVFPNVFWVGFTNSQYMYKTKPAVIRNMSVDYTGGQGVPSFYRTTENAPESVILTLTFLELEYWIRDNFQPGNESLPSDNPFDPQLLNWYRRS